MSEFTTPTMKGELFLGLVRKNDFVLPTGVAYGVEK